MIKVPNVNTINALLLNWRLKARAAAPLPHLDLPSTIAPATPWRIPTCVVCNKYELDEIAKEMRHEVVSSTPRDLSISSPSFSHKNQARSIQNGLRQLREGIVIGFLCVPCT